MAKYLALTGINWPDGRGGEKRAEAGEVVDLPATVARALIEGGAVVPEGKAAVAAAVDGPATSDGGAD